jgi:hypothetical protein
MYRWIMHPGSGQYGSGLNKVVAWVNMVQQEKQEAFEGQLVRHRIDQTMVLHQQKVMWCFIRPGQTGSVGSMGGRGPSRRIGAFDRDDW